MDTQMHPVKEILKCIDVFLDSYDHWEWMRKAAEDDVTKMFKCAKDVENICFRMEEIDCKVDFENKIKTWWKVKHMAETNCDFTFFRNACDMILKRFLTGYGIENNVAVLAVGKYVSHCGIERLKLLLKNLIQQVEENRALNTTIEKLIDSSECSEIVFKSEATNLLWKEHVTFGRDVVVSQQVLKMTSDPTEMEVVLRVMLMNYKGDETSDLKKIISETLLVEMKANKKGKLWHILFSDANRSLMLLVCKHYPAFLSAITDFITINARSMTCSYTAEGSRWNSTEDSSVEFVALVKIVKCLMESKGVVRRRMNSVLQEMKNSPNSAVWIEIERQCALPVYLR